MSERNKSGAGAGTPSGKDLPLAFIIENRYPLVMFKRLKPRILGFTNIEF
ncbi:hypothetical protein [Candidatus Protochlamydia naegleriophila]|nr:hypothetical protein [Candidatus Protochlamydia naegleriophila]